jgi:hypothetical protein
MEDQVLEVKELSIEEYLGLFQADSADFSLVKSRSDRLAKIVLKKVKDASGRVFEDTTFIEKTGVQYTIRAKMD